MLDEITEKEITSRQGLEKIDYLLDELYWCHNLSDLDYNKKQYVIDFFNRLYEELKSLTNVSVLLETCLSPDEVKNDIEAVLLTINDLYYNSETFDLNDGEINETKQLLNQLLDDVYAEIGNRMNEE